MTIVGGEGGLVNKKRTIFFDAALYSDIIK